MRSVTWRLQDACFKGSCTELWRPWAEFSLLLQWCAKGTLHSLAPSPGSLGLVSLSLLEIPHNHLHPRTGYFLPPLVFLVPVAQPLPSPLPFLLFPLTTTPTPLPACQGLCNTLAPPGPWAIPSLVEGQELQGNTTVVWLDPDTAKKTNKTTLKSLFSQQTQRKFGVCWNSTSDKSI